jgi:GNAT superfamily N-acetyltransferase
MEAPVVIEPFYRHRSELLTLFAQADDSSTQIKSYIELGEVFVARRGCRIIGHLQLIANTVDWEIKSVAVIDSERGKGVGARLVHTALDRATAGSAMRVLVSTASADTSNLRFYQRLGFRMERIEPDAFGTHNGYRGLQNDGIPVRDRVWLYASCLVDRQTVADEYAPRGATFILE